MKWRQLNKTSYISIPALVSIMKIFGRLWWCQSIGRDTFPPKAFGTLKQAQHYADTMVRQNDIEIKACNE